MTPEQKKEIREWFFMAYILLFVLISGAIVALGLRIDFAADKIIAHQCTEAK